MTTAPRSASPLGPAGRGGPPAAVAVLPSHPAAAAASPQSHALPHLQQSGATSPAAGNSIGGTPGGGAAPKPSKFAIFDAADDYGLGGLSVGDGGAGNTRQQQAAAGPPRSFHEAAERGDTAYCVRAIERTVAFDVDAPDRHARTALHWAVEMGHHETARALLDFGADARAPDCAGRTAVHLAARCGDAAMLELIVGSGGGGGGGGGGGLSEADALALINQPDRLRMTPAFLSAQRGEEGRSAFEWLLRRGAVYTEEAHATAAAAAAMAAAQQQQQYDEGEY